MFKALIFSNKALKALFCVIPAISWDETKKSFESLIFIVVP